MILKKIIKKNTEISAQIKNILNVINNKLKKIYYNILIWLIKQTF